MPDEMLPPYNNALASFEFLQQSGRNPEDKCDFLSVSRRVHLSMMASLWQSHLQRVPLSLPARVNTRDMPPFQLQQLNPMCYIPYNFMPLSTYSNPTVLPPVPILQTKVKEEFGTLKKEGDKTDTSTASPKDGEVTGKRSLSETLHESGKYIAGHRKSYSAYARKCTHAKSATCILCLIYS